MSVSSEVRRTLVKSPPELWAELSDPATLARHLSELGEIRITGTDPERLIDWEATSADGAGAALSGRVEIEPSGWGTRVTLSVSRETVEAEAETEAEAEAVTKTETEAKTETQTETVPEIALGAGSEVETETEPVGTTPESEPTSEATFESASASASALIVEHVEIAAASVVTASPTALGAASEPEMAEVPQASEPASKDGPETTTQSEPHQAEPGPREGFFARLFRRRKRQPELIASETAAPEPELATSKPEALTPEPEPIEIEAEAETETETEQPERESKVQPEPEPEAQSEPAPVAIAAEETAFDDTAAEVKMDLEDPAADSKLELASEAPAGADEREPATPTTTSDAGTAPDIAAELAELEQQTTAVLTGVLDRLGAAHHRPFSRA
jgi:hypothetical protein